MDDDERKDKTQSTVSTIECLHRVNKNKLIQKRIEKGEEESNEEEDRQFQAEITTYMNEGLRQIRITY